jgi:hypothetical protein
VLALSRPVPEFPPALSAANTNASKNTDTIATGGRAMLGFMPNKHTQETAALTIDRVSNSAELSKPSDSAPLTFLIEGSAQLATGTYTVLLKQQAPLWYAPDDYFTARGLDIPGQGARERFRRGALGSQAIFLSGETPIHAGPTWSDEVGGIRLDPTTMAALFEALHVGAQVVVR